MTNRAERELDEIIKSFRDNPARSSELRNKLLKLYQMHRDLQKGMEHGLTPARVSKHIADINESLEKAKSHFEQLFRVSLGTEHLYSQPAVAEANEREVIITRDIPVKHIVEDSKHNLSWFVDVLEALKVEMSNLTSEAFGIQSTKANLNEAAVLRLAMVCNRHNIQLSASRTSRFYRLCQWLLGLQDPRSLIFKVIKDL